jgi:hypothetical protein
MLTPDRASKCLRNKRFSTFNPTGESISSFGRTYRDCEEQSDQAIQFYSSSGLLRGACQRARIRATRWLAMTITFSH